MGELKFDKMVIDTRLAEEFLKANKAELDLFIDESKQDTRRHLHEITKLNTKTGGQNLELDVLLSALAKKIENNSELFAQLEYLKRKVSKDDIKSYDINLLVQNLKYMSNNQWHSTQEMTGHGGTSYALDYIVMGETTPLATLGIAAQYFCECQSFTIQYCDTTAAICYLFARLYREIGLTETLYSAWFTYKKNIKEIVNRKGGCTGVVTEHSDVDSAVDAFLASTSSPVQYKWKLQRIFVQESVYEHFKKTLSWKCNLKQSSNQSCADVCPQSSDVHIYDQKVFFVNFAGTLEQIKDTRHVILVEAYRTTKELLAMLKKDVPFCVSLWSNDVSESNEIAYNLNVNIVWINDLGVFDGPIKISQALYFLRQPYMHFGSADSPNKVLKMLEGWSKISIYDRVERIKNVLDVSKNLDHNIVFYVKQAMRSLQNCASNKNVFKEKGKMWIVVDEPNGVVCQKFDDKYDKHLIHILTSVALGNVLIIWNRENIDPKHLNILKVLGKENLPIICDDAVELCDKSDNSNTNISIHISLYQTRVVYSNYGTIFAN